MLGGSQQHRGVGTNRKAASIFCWIGTFCDLLSRLALSTPAWQLPVVGSCNFQDQMRLFWSICREYFATQISISFSLLFFFKKEDRLLVMIKFIPECLKECWNCITPTPLSLQNYPHARSQFLSNLFNIVNRYIITFHVKPLYFELSMLRH